MHSPVVLSSLDQDYFGKFAPDMGRPSRRDQHDRETVAALVCMAARNLERAFCSARKKLFQLVGVLRVADTVAEHRHAVFEISGLPCVQEMVRGSEGKHVTRVEGIRLQGWMAARSSPDWG